MEKEIEKYRFSNEPTGIHRLVIDRVPNGSRVLDVGCASGYVGEFLIKEKGCRLYGIESNAQSAQEAKAIGYEVVATSPVEQAISMFAGEKFDVIILADVLEHLVDPLGALVAIKNLLDANGQIIVSLPNIAHYSIRSKILFGDFNATETGILDGTHLHHYTLESATKLFESANLTVREVRPRGDLERWGRSFGLETLGRSLLFLAKKFFAIQFVYVLK